MSNESLKGQLATRAAGGDGEGAPTVFQLLERHKPQLARALPAGMSPDRLARVILTEVRKTPQLATCTQDSLLGAFLNAAQLGLEPGPLGQVYLIPRMNRRAGVREVQLLVGYRGIIDLALRGGRTLSIDAHVVRDGEDFDFTYGTDPFLRHRPAVDVEPGEVRCAYAVAKLREGGAPFVVLPMAEIEKRRARGGDSDRGPWTTDFDAMARKTAIRALAPYLPQTVEFAFAQRVDETVRTDLGASLDEYEPPEPDADDQVEDAEIIDEPPPEKPKRSRAKKATVTDDVCTTCGTGEGKHEPNCPEAPEDGAGDA